MKDLSGARQCLQSAGCSLVILEWREQVGHCQTTTKSWMRWCACRRRDIESNDKSVDAMVCLPEVRHAGQQHGECACRRTVGHSELRHGGLRAGGRWDIQSYDMEVCAPADGGTSRTTWRFAHRRTVGHPELHGGLRAGGRWDIQNYTKIDGRGHVGCRQL